jgi:hypothetical protein
MSKDTQSGHAARKKVQIFLQTNPHLFREVKDPRGRNPHVAYADGVIAVSGRMGADIAGGADDEHGGYGDYCVDLRAPDLIDQFNGMIAGHGFAEVATLARGAYLCAEASLWMALFARHIRYVQQGQAPRHRHLHPRHLDAWVFEIDGHNRPKEASPCENCRQWVRKEFRTFNGT